MTDKRRTYNAPEQISLTTQVGGLCPLCGVSLFYSKKGKPQKGYEIAHIYPLKPKPEEIDLLKNEKRLHSDVNHLDNLIPLCLRCHGKFDKPRTVEEYRTLFSIKEELIRRAEQQEIQAQYGIEEDITRVIDGLYSSDLTTEGVELEFDPKDLTQKLNDSITRPTQQKIRHNVTDYYFYIKYKLIEIEQESPNTTDLISSQVKTYYLKQKSLCLSQQEIFSNIVGWLNTKTKPKTVEAAEIVASFFVQNCEIFE